MRPISVSNFVSSNIEYVEFWMMDPYADGNPIGTNPKLLLQLGNVSEDILKDGQMQYENGLPTPAAPSTTTSSNWEFNLNSRLSCMLFQVKAQTERLRTWGMMV